jgi:hypothetical protein
MVGRKPRRYVHIPLTLVPLALAVTLLAGPSARAQSLSLSHLPPPIAMEAQPLSLTAEIASPCFQAFFTTCGPVRLTAFYVRPSGVVASRTVEGTDAHLQMVTVTVPAGAVRTPALWYSLGATQETCKQTIGGTARCTTTTASWPQLGRHGVMVAPRPTGG